MAWETLPTNYTDATWTGLRKYTEITNDDGTVSFQDMTKYSNRENSFFGAKEANQMNEALNILMNMVENGTNLYSEFQNYFTTQQGLFKSNADTTLNTVSDYADKLKKQGDDVISGLKDEYKTEIDGFETNQQKLFNDWFSSLKTQLDENTAGNLQNQIDTLDTKTDGFNACNTVFSTDGKTITEVSGDKKVVTVFESSSKIVQKLYENDVLTLTKTVTFSEDGLSITEEVL